jgi:sulfatase maturation enzyme AslB (radical SAM superfamily)
VIQPAEPILDSLLLYPCGNEGVVFDPVSLESASLTAAEVEAARLGTPEIRQALEECGFPIERSEPQRNALFSRLRELGMSSQPARISGYRVVLTDHCNMKCTYCFVDTNTGASDMSKDDLRVGLEFLAEQNAGQREITVQWFGGEPTIRFDLMKHGDRYLRELAERFHIGRVQSTVVTNGAAIRDEMIEHFSEYRYGVGVSFDGSPSENSIERFLLSGRPADRSIARNVRRLVEAGVHIGCNLTPTAANVSDLPKAIDYVFSLGVRFVYVNTPIPITGQWHVDGKALADALFTCRMIALSRGGMLFSALDRIYQGLDSRIPRMLEHIQRDGGINAALLPGGRVSVLDLNWRHPEFIFTIEELRDRPELLASAGKDLLPSDSCSACPAAGICGGPTRNEVALRGTAEPDPQMCAFFLRGLERALLDQTGLQ